MEWHNPNIFKDLSEGDNWSTEESVCPVRENGGSDYGYKAGNGWDPVYGLGSINVGLMIEWLDKNT